MIKRAMFDLESEEHCKFVLECCDLFNIENNSDCDNDSDSDDDNNNMIVK